MNHLQCRRPQFDSWVRKIPWRRDRLPTPVFLSFPGGSAGKESAWNAGDLSLIPGLGRSPGEGKGYPLQYSGLEDPMDCIAKSMDWSKSVRHDWVTFTITVLSWASEVPPVIKNQPDNAGEVRKRLWSLDQEDPLEEGTETHRSILAWKIPSTEEPGGLQSVELQRVGHDWNDLTHTFSI